MNNHYFEAELPRRRHVLVSSLYYVLYDLSPPVLCVLIDRFGGRLSALVDAFDAWALECGVDEACKRDDFVAFVTARWGASDVVTSLVRYMAALASMSRPSRRHVVSPAPAIDDSTDAWILNPEARMLRDIHDCGRLLEHLDDAHSRRTPPLTTAASAPPPVTAATPSPPAGGGVVHPVGHRGAVPLSRLRAQIEARWDELVQRHPPLALPVETGARCDFLVVPIPGTDEVRNVQLDPNLAEFIEIFAQPRSLRQVTRSMGRARATPLLAELRRLEILAPVPVPSLSQPTRSAIRISAS
jgi:hypothetical protein